MFDLSEKTSPSQISISMPTSRYLEFYADFLNKLLILTVDREAFTNFMIECLPNATTSEIEDAREVSTYKLSQINHP
jgi:hypothetical protein